MNGPRTEIQPSPSASTDTRERQFGFDYTFTVFTPTYNRARTLHRVYDSLRRQTFRDFEWLIVDDGSTDDTREVVDGWRKAAGFPIRYVFQNNSGKHVAINTGVRDARGALFLIIDSDDALVPMALERFKFHWDSIPSDRKHRFSAVTSLCMDQHGKRVGNAFPEDVFDSDSLELHFRYDVAGEKCGFHRTDVLRDHPFPEPGGVKFVAEGVVWFAIARKYKTRFVNECLRVYYQSDSGGDRLSVLTQPTAQGRLLFHAAVLNDYFDYMSSSPVRVMRSAVNYCRYSLLCGIGLRTQLGELGSSWPQLALIAASPVGYALYARDRVRALLRP